MCHEEILICVGSHSKGLNICRRSLRSKHFREEMLAQASSEIVFADGFSPSVPSNGINESSLSSTKSLFVGDLSFFCTEVDLGPLFAKFGNLASLEVKRGRHGDSLMHGFVEYELESSAQVAIAELNNRKFMGRCMRYF